MQGADLTLQRPQPRPRRLQGPLRLCRLPAAPCGSTTTLGPALAPLSCCCTAPRKQQGLQGRREQPGAQQVLYMGLEACLRAGMRPHVPCCGAHRQGCLHPPCTPTTVQTGPAAQAQTAAGPGAAAAASTHVLDDRTLKGLALVHRDAQSLEVDAIRRIHGVRMLLLLLCSAAPGSPARIWGP